MWHIDILVPFKNDPLIIEYDGEYAHKTKYRDNDIRKTEELVVSGYNVIRLREGSLPLYNNKWDIPVPKLNRSITKRRLELKSTTNLILIKIKENYLHQLTDDQKTRIEEYFKEVDLTNIDSKEQWVYDALKSKVEARELRNSRRKTLMPFSKAKEFARSLKLRSESQWRLYVRNKTQNLPSKPANVPSYPERVYKSLGWISYQDWLDLKTREWIDFDHAKLWIKELHLKGELEWRKYLRGEILYKPELPENIPRTPRKVYKNQWIGIKDWLSS